MIRRDFLQCIGGTLGTLMHSNSSSAAHVPGLNRPNIVIVLTDDMGYSDLGCYGGEINTPNIDRLATDGLRFKTFYNCALCGPTRASLLTGLYNCQVGIMGWNGQRRYDRCVMVQEVLQKAGYTTMMVGKWQDNGRTSERGWDRFFGMKCNGPVSYWNATIINPMELDGRPFDPPDNFYLTDAFNDQAVKFINEEAGRNEPIFLYVAHMAPHWPLHAKEKDIAKYRKIYKRLGWGQARQDRLRRLKTMGLVREDLCLSSEGKRWETEKNREWQAERMAVYAAQIEGVDHGVGKIVEALERKGVLHDTLIMILSDNGATDQGARSDGDLNTFTKHILDREDIRAALFPGRNPIPVWRKDGKPMSRAGNDPAIKPGPPDTFASYEAEWAHLSNTPFRGFKETFYEGGIRTPLVVHWPRGIRNRGTIAHEIGHVIDVMPTCLQLAGCKYPEELDGRVPLPVEGRSLVQVFQGVRCEPHEALFWILPGRGAVRMGKWKLLRSSKEQPKLYDLEKDPSELHDLAKEYPSVLDGLVERYESWKTQSCKMGETTEAFK